MESTNTKDSGTASNRVSTRRLSPPGGEYYATLFNGREQPAAAHSSSRAAVEALKSKHGLDLLYVHRKATPPQLIYSA